MRSARRMARLASLGKLSAKTLALAVVFLLSLKLSLDLHMASARARAHLVSAVNEWLANQFAGKIRVRGLRNLDSKHLSLAEATVHAPDGSLVLQINQAEVEYTLGELLAGLLTSKPPRVTLSKTRVEDIFLSSATQGGTLTLVRAFERPARPKQHKPSTKVVAELRSVRVNRLQVVGHTQPVGDWTAELAPIAGTLSTGESLHAKLEPITFRVTTSKGLHATGEAALSNDDDGRLHIDAQAHLNQALLRLNITASHDEVNAHVHASQLGASLLGKVIAGWPALDIEKAELRLTRPSDKTTTFEFDSKLALGTPDNQPRAFVAVRLNGSATTEPNAAAKASLSLASDSLQNYWASAPRGPLRTTGTASVTFPPRGTPSWEVQLELPPTALFDLSLPPMHASVAGDRSRLAATLRAPSWGLDASSVVDLAEEGLPWSARVAPLSLDVLATLGGSTQPTEATLPQGELELQASGRLGSERPWGLVTAVLHDIQWRGWFSPRVDLGLSPLGSGYHLETRARRVGVGGVIFQDTMLTYDGALRAGRITGSSRLRSAELSLEAKANPLQLSLQRARLSATSQTVVAELKNADLSVDSIAVPSLELRSGRGTVTGAAVWTPHHAALKLQASSFSLGPPWREMFGTSAPIDGLLSGRVEVSQDQIGAADASVSVANLQVAGLPLGEATLNATLTEGNLQATTSLVTPLGALRGELRATGPQRPWDAEQWAQTHGSLLVESDPLPLWPLFELSGQNTPLQSLDGNMKLRLDIGLEQQSSSPSIQANVELDDVDFTLASANGEPGFGGSNLGVQLSGTLAPQSGHLSLAAHVHQGERALLRGALSTFIPQELLSSSLKRELIPKLRQLPLQGQLLLGALPLSAWPVGLQQSTATFDGRLWLAGTVADPRLSLSCQLTDEPDDGKRGGGAEARGFFKYAPRGGQLTGTLGLDVGGRQVGRAEVSAEVAAPMNLQHVSVGAIISRLPLQSLPFSRDLELGGDLIGGVQLSGPPSQLTVRGHLRTQNLSARGEPLGPAELDVESEDSFSSIRLLVGGNGQLQARAFLEHGNEEPPWSPSSANIELHSRSLALQLLEPLLAPAASGLGGEVDGDLQARWRAGSSSQGAEQLHLSGQLQISHGRAHVGALGMSIDQIRAALSANSNPSGTTTSLRLRVNEARAQSSDDNLEMMAEATLHGLQLTEARGSVELQGVPLSLGGVSRGVATGTAQMTLTPHTKVHHLDVQFPQLRVELPSSITRSLIDTAPHPDVSLSTVTQEARSQPSDARPWRISIDLGEDFHLRREDIDVQLSGQPIVTLNTHVLPQGNIEVVPGGRVTIFDRTFTIERGRLSLSPEQPKDPAVDLSAQWRASDGTTVYVTITGTASQAEITTRDDRGLSEAERFELLLGGRPSESADDRSSATAVALGQAMATLGLNQALRNSLGDVSVRVSTTDDQQTSYAASYRISDRLWVEGNFEMGSSQDQASDPNRFTGRLDYRLSRHWSIRTELSTAGSALDLLWTYAY